MEKASEEEKKSGKRRSFLRTAAIAGAASLTGVSPSKAEAAAPNAGRKLKIGAIGVGDYSFWAYSWGDILSTRGIPVNKSTLGTGILNMEVSHVWDKDPDVARTFADKVGAEPVGRYDGMVGKVDGVAFGGYYEVPWQHRLARPYIEAGIPTYLSRPFAYSLRDIDSLLECAAKHGTPIMATDIYEHLYGVETIKGSLGRIGEIQCVHGTCLTHDYAALFHTQFMILKIFGFDVGKVSVVTDDPNNSAYLAGTYLFNGREGQMPFLCHLTMTPNGDLYSFDITGTSGSEHFRLPVFANWRDDLLVHHTPMLVAMQRTFEGENFEAGDLIRAKTELFLTGFYSATERGGAPVDMGALPADWRARPAKPDWIDETVFG